MLSDSVNLFSKKFLPQKKFWTDNGDFFAPHFGSGWHNKGCWEDVLRKENKKYWDEIERKYQKYQSRM